MGTRYDFDGADHANRYLRNSVIRVGGRPVVAMSVARRGGELALSYLPIPIPSNEGARENEIPLSSRDVDLTPIPLGFMNFLDRVETRSLFRLPLRDWKIGLSTHSARVRRLDVHYYDPIEFTQLCGVDAYNVYTGRYPSISTAIERLSGRGASKGGSVAFSRRFAIDVGRAVWSPYIPKPIGQIDFDSERITLNKDSEFFRQALEEDKADVD